MAQLLRRRPQQLPDIPAQGSGDSMPDIPASIFSSGLTNDHTTVNINPSIEAATATPTVSSSVLPSSTVATTTPTATSSTSSSPTPAPHHGTSPGKIVAIVVPIVAVILIIPLIFLLFRSHQFKRDEKRRNSARSPMLPPGPMMERQPSLKKEPAPQLAPVKTFTEPRSPPTAPGAQQRSRTTNSMGLFDFDLGASPTEDHLYPPAAYQPARSPSPDMIKNPPQVSVAQAVQVRRSQPSIISNRRPSGRISGSQQSQNSQPSVLLDPPPPYPAATAPAEQAATATSPAQPHFAPLNRIGYHSRNNSRPNLHRNPSSGAISTVTDATRPAVDSEQPPLPAQRAPSPGFLPQIHRESLHLGSDRFTMSQYSRTSHYSDISSLSDEEAIHIPSAPVGSQSYNTQYDSHHGHAHGHAAPSPGSSPTMQGTAAQPYRIL